ncbi:hypothetical protein LMJ53_15645 [Rheinheimera sp. UJ51]|uniref:hypothetical protein n=1 Tax=Rheinheimera sp. UJ51 TaxID=2892446 RepID=UPI001E424554|nr:hypothetical protein [Rheinheimera sp. UJ51]MCC5453154.1 hypothetical protein [Rheinheimera sp. UJ51]
MSKLDDFEIQYRDTMLSDINNDIKKLGDYFNIKLPLLAVPDYSKSNIECSGQPPVFNSIWVNSELARQKDKVLKTLTIHLLAIASEIKLGDSRLRGNFDDVAEQIAMSTLDRSQFWTFNPEEVDMDVKCNSLYISWSDIIMHFSDSFKEKFNFHKDSQQ